MHIIWFIIASALSGMVAGMGMGGGTILIPVLTIFFHLEQHAAQAINLFAFLPTAVVSLMIHIKNKLVDFKKGICIILSGIVFSIGGSLLASKLNNRILQVLFGVFLLLIGLIQLGNIIYHHFANKKQDNKIEIKNYKVVFGSQKDLNDYDKK